MNSQLPSFLKEHIQESQKMVRRRYGDETRYYFDSFQIIQSGHQFNAILNGVDIGIMAANEMMRLLNEKFKKKRRGNGQR